MDWILGRTPTLGAAVERPVPLAVFTVFALLQPGQYTRTGWMARYSLTPARESNSIVPKLERWIDMRNMFQGPKLGRSPNLAIAALLVLPFLGSPVLAQRTTASVAGSIVDASGATVPAAQVLLRNLSTGAERTVETNELGIYVVTALPAGPYSLTVKKPDSRRRPFPN